MRSPVAAAAAVVVGVVVEETVNYSDCLVEVLQHKFENEV